MKKLLNWTISINFNSINNKDNVYWIHVIINLGMLMGGRSQCGGGRWRRRCWKYNRESS